MKDSIKREQSQAGLSFAERKNQRSLAGGESNFRPKVKRNKLLLLLALLLTAATGAWAEEQVVYTLDGTQTASNTAYANAGVVNQDGITWMVTGNVNQNPWRIGGKDLSGVDRPVWSENSLDETVTKVTLEFGEANSITVNSITMTVAGDADFNNVIDSKAVNFSANNTVDVTPTEGKEWKNAYYRFVFNVSVSGSSNKYLQLKSIKFYNDPDAPAGYTVSMKSGVKDADKWTVKVGEGQAQALPIGGLKGDGSETVTLQYNGRLKVKGVKATSDAAPAKTPATVTTAPTGAAIVGVGKNTALVSGGAADGGTLWYAVTTTNTKPTSTDGFSDAVPTAQTITASGTVYVWYFVKADDTHTDSEIAATAIEVPVADIVWDVTNVSDLYVTGTGWTYEMEGITLSGNAEDVKAQWFDFGNPEMDGIGFDLFETGGFTFTAPTGKAFTKIVMTLIGSVSWDNANLGTGWAFNWDFGTGIATVTWTGSAASTVDLLKDADEFTGSYAKSIAFYLSE